MIKVKSQEDIELMRIACRITRDTLNLLQTHVKAGISTYELNKIAEEYIISQGATPTFKHYNGFPAGLCTSVNDVIVHGIPRKDQILKEGDIISLDVGAKYKGFTGDAARTFPVGKVSSDVAKLITVTEQCFFEGIKGLHAGCFVGDISHRVQLYAEKHGYGVVREMVGHGVGKNLHEDPQIPNYGTAGMGPKIPANCTLAIEPMINMGKKDVKFGADGWKCSTLDGLPSAHYENTVLITENGVEILTL